MTNTGEAVPIEYGVYTSSYEDEMATLLGEVFARRDPLAFGAGVTPKEFEAFVRLFLPKANTERLTIVARFADTGELVGAMLNEDCASEMPDGLDRLSPSFDPIFDILGQLDEEYSKDREISPGEAVHLFLLGVSDVAAGRGVAQELVVASLKHGLERGYRLAVTEATNKASQHIFRKLGFEERVKGSYGEYRFGGEAFFASIADHGGPILMDKKLL